MNKVLKKYDDRAVEVEIDGQERTLKFTKMHIEERKPVESGGEKGGFFKDINLIFTGFFTCPAVSEKKKYFAFGLTKIPATEELEKAMKDVIQQATVMFNNEAGVYDRIREKYLKKNE